MVRFEMLKRILEICRETGIKVMPMKGVVLSEKFYPSRNLREMVDIDLLVPAIDKDEEVNKRLKKTIFELQGEFGSMYTSIQLHNTWRIHMGFWKSAYETERIWKRSIETEIMNVKVPIMSPEDSFLMNCYHSLGHARLNLRDLCDAFVILKNERYRLDWDYILRTAMRTWISVPLYNTLKILKDILDADEIPEYIFTELEKNREVKSFRFFLRFWSVTGGLFDIASLIYREICRLRSLGASHFLKLYLEQHDRAGIGLLSLSRDQKYS
jgi:hypothetical protein